MTEDKEEAGEEGSAFMWLRKRMKAGGKVERQVEQLLERK